MSPLEARPQEALRLLGWWLAGSLVYLQGLSLIRSLDVRPLSALPWAALAAGLLVLLARHRGPLGLDALLTALIATAVTAVALIRPPVDFDDLLYHLPYAASWLQTGTTGPPYLAVHGPIGYYPGNFELLTTSALAVTGTTHLFHLPNTISLLLLLLVTAAIAARVGVRPGLVALFAMLLVLTSKSTRRVVLSGYNDLFLAATLITALYFLDTFRRERRMGDLILSGAFAGIAVGTKYSGLLYGAALLAAAVVLARSFRGTTAWTGALLLPSVWWYARNAVLTGNPFYPQPVTLFGHELLPGVVHTTTERTMFFRLGDTAYLSRLLDAMVTNGHILFLPLAAFFLWNLGRHRELRLYFTAGVIAFVIYLFTPLSARTLDLAYLNFRFALPALWLLMLVGVLAALDRWKPGRIEAWLVARPIPLPRILVAVLALALLVGTGVLHARGYRAGMGRSHPEWGPGFAVADSLGPARIAWTGPLLPGGLYGRRLQNDVRYVDLKTRWAGESALKTMNPDYLCFAGDHELTERDWSVQVPEPFHPVWRSERFAILRAQPGSMGRSIGLELEKQRGGPIGGAASP